MNHILIVDDEAEIRGSLEEILREEGYGVATAGTAAEAITLLQDAPYDVVLLDIWLPDRDGLDALNDIRQMDSAHIPEVIIISGHGTIEAAVRAGHLPAQDTGLAATALLGALHESLVGPLAPDHTDDPAKLRDAVQTVTLLALRAVGVMDARARGLVVQAVLPAKALVGA